MTARPTACRRPCAAHARHWHWQRLADVSYPSGLPMEIRRPPEELGPAVLKGDGNLVLGTQGVGAK